MGAQEKPLRYPQEEELFLVRGARSGKRVGVPVERQGRNSAMRGHRMPFGTLPSRFSQAMQCLRPVHLGASDGRTKQSGVADRLTPRRFPNGRARPAQTPHRHCTTSLSRR